MLSISLILQFGLHTFGFRTAFGHIEMFLQEAFLPEKWMPKIGIAYFLIVTAVSIVVGASLSIFIHFVLFLVLFLLKKGIHQFRLLTILKAIPEWLSLCDVQLRLGSSLQTALSKIKSTEKGWRKTFIVILLQSLTYSSGKIEAQSIFDNEILKKFFEGISAINSAKVNQWERLVEFEKQIARELDFRHRSSQVLLQNRLQTVVVAFLHLILSFASVRTVGWQQMSPIVLTSTLLVGCGAFVSYQMGRKISWKY